MCHVRDIEYTKQEVLMMPCKRCGLQSFSKGRERSGQLCMSTCRCTVWYNPVMLQYFGT